jgi:hypothetical protein
MESEIRENHQVFRRVQLAKRIPMPMLPWPPDRSALRIKLGVTARKDRDALRPFSSFKRGGVSLNLAGLQVFMQQIASQLFPERSLHFHRSRCRAKDPQKGLEADLSDGLE